MSKNCFHLQKYLLSTYSVQHCAQKIPALKKHSTYNTHTHSLMSELSATLERCRSAKREQLTLSLWGLENPQRRLLSCRALRIGSILTKEKGGKSIPGRGIEEGTARRSEPHWKVQEQLNVYWICSECKGGKWGWKEVWIGLWNALNVNLSGCPDF